ncbi:MAG: type II toxin-antitoxin system RelB family antitoxin [Ruminiclostridium sp.]
MTVSLRLSDDDAMLIKKYAETNGISVSELVRRSVLERIEEEYDLNAFEKAMEEYRKTPKTYSLDEIKKELGF